MCDEGPILPKPGYLSAVKELCQKHNCLLIFDEVITGFRLSLGGAQQYFGVTPDMAVFGKAIAGGISLSMICGKKEVMSKVHPSGTFNATPIAVAASLATIAELEKPGTYEKMDALGKKLTEGIVELAHKHGLKAVSYTHLFPKEALSFLRIPTPLPLRPTRSGRRYPQNSFRLSDCRAFLS